VKVLIILTLILGLGQLNATEYEILAGSLTQHFWMNKEIGPLYSNKVNSRGLIANPMVGVGVYGKEFKTTLFGGENSVGLPMAGVKFTFIAGSKDFGLFLGGYYQDNQKFTEKSGLIVGNAVWNIVPIFGIEYNPTLFKIGGVKVKLNNSFTPVLSTHAIGLNFSF
jgi:hypothetical protein